MRILIATDAFPPNCGGSGWSTWELARVLRARGHELTIVQPRPGTARGERVREHDDFSIMEFGSPAPAVPFVRNYFKNERLTARLTPWISHLVRDRRIDIIHAQHVLTIPPAIAAGGATATPVVCTVRDYWPVCYWSDLIVDRRSLHLCPQCSCVNMTRCVRPRARQAWPLALPMIPYMRANLARKRASLAHADAVIAVSGRIAADLRQRAPELAAARIETIPNPVALHDIRCAAASVNPLAAPYALYVGKLAPNKGTGWLVDVARAADLRWPLIVVGDGPDRARVEADAKASELDVRMVGWQPRDVTLRWLAHATVVVFPSHGPESLSRVLLEAGALGRPIAAMNTGGTGDIIEHERTGLLSSSPQGLARDFGRLVQDAALRATLGSAVQAHVTETFESERVVDRIAALYEEVIDKAHRG
jgi:glycosyltransferase involved in cell wall biosynthesis